MTHDPKKLSPHQAGETKSWACYFDTETQQDIVRVQGAKGLNSRAATIRYLVQCGLSWIQQAKVNSHRQVTINTPRPSSSWPVEDQDEL